MVYDSDVASSSRTVIAMSNDIAVATIGKR